MKKYSFYVFILLSIVSCKKEDCPDWSGLVHTISLTYGPTHYFETYSYDDQRRLIRLDNSQGYFTTYSYNGDTIILRNYDSTNQLGSTSTCFLNENSVIDSIISTNTNTKYSKHFYDAEGHLISTNTYDYAFELSYVSNNTYSDGNLVLARLDIGNGNNLTQNEYEYYSDKENIISGLVTGQYYGGKASSNLVKHRVTTFSADSPDPTIMISDYVYSYDSQGRIEVITISTINQPETVKVYTYY